jgi:hypothetical protein
MSDELKFGKARLTAGVRVFQEQIRRINVLWNEKCLRSFPTADRRNGPHREIFDRMERLKKAFSATGIDTGTHVEPQNLDQLKVAESDIGRARDAAAALIEELEALP